MNLQSSAERGSERKPKKVILLTCTQQSHKTCLALSWICMEFYPFSPSKSTIYPETHAFSKLWRTLTRCWCTDSLETGPRSNRSLSLIFLTRSNLCVPLLTRKVVFSWSLICQIPPFHISYRLDLLFIGLPSSLLIAHVYLHNERFCALRAQVIEIGTSITSPQRKRNPQNVAKEPLTLPQKYLTLSFPLCILAFLK